MIFSINCFFHNMPVFLRFAEVNKVRFFRVRFYRNEKKLSPGNKRFSSKIIVLRKTKKTRTGYSSLNKIKLVHGGRPYFDQLLQMIRQAEEIIQLQVYIYDHDETEKEITEALKAAAERNVQVYLL